jgi:hypothetical protein
MSTKLISTSALAKEFKIPKNELDAHLSDLNYAVKIEGTLQLTEQGIAVGGEYLESKRFGRYIGWPSDLQLPNISIGEKTTLKASDLAKHFDLSARRINLVLSELGWIEKSLKGWKVTSSGVTAGGIQKESFQSGVPFAEWDKRILVNKTLVASISELKGDASSDPEDQQGSGSENDKSSENFRTKFEAKFRSTDGHFVRSKAEMLIDNWLYMAEVVHAYERKLPIEEDVYCDFYIPTGKIYIEYWGYDNDTKYLARKEKKQALYKKYGFKLIELDDSDVENLDDVLPRLLLKNGVQTY